MCRLNAIAVTKCTAAAWNLDSLSEACTKSTEIDVNNYTRNTNVTRDRFYDESQHNGNDLVIR